MNENPMEQVEQTPETPAAEPVPAPEQKKGLSENAKEWIKDILIAIVVAFLVLQFIKPTIVQEHSMENTLVANDYLFISKQSYRLFGDPQRGDIIVFHSSLTTSDGSEKLLVPQDEPYTKDGYTNTEMDEVYVPEGKLFCMGDNRQNSRDSRDSAIGLVDEDDVLGKAVFRLFPFSRIGGLY